MRKKTKAAIGNTFGAVAAVAVGAAGLVLAFFVVRAGRSGELHNLLGASPGDPEA